jgi:hypothetical protein
VGVPIRPVRDGDAGPPDGDRAAAAAYVAVLTAELAAIARRHNLNTLSYLLDMARLEAEGTSEPV